MRVRNPNIQRIIESHVREWFLRREEGPEVRKPPILISRQRGAGAHEVAERLSRRLGWPYYGKNIIYEVARALKADPRQAEFLDERSRSILLEYANVFVKDPQTFQEDYILYLKRFLKKLGHVGSCVIVGRGANFVIPAAEALRVRLVGRPEGWKEAVLKRYGLPERDLEKVFEEWDREQRDFIKRYFGADVADPRNYDITINLDHYNWDRATELILEAYRRKFPGVSIVGSSRR